MGVNPSYAEYELADQRAAEHDDEVRRSMPDRIDELLCGLDGLEPQRAAIARDAYNLLGDTDRRLPRAWRALEDTLHELKATAQCG